MFGELLKIFLLAVGLFSSLSAYTIQEVLTEQHLEHARQFVDSYTPNILTNLPQCEGGTPIIFENIWNRIHQLWQNQCLKILICTRKKKPYVVGLLMYHHFNYGQEFVERFYALEEELVTESMGTFDPTSINIAACIARNNQIKSSLWTTLMNNAHPTVNQYSIKIPWYEQYQAQCQQEIAWYQTAQFIVKNQCERCKTFYLERILPEPDESGKRATMTPENFATE